MGDTSAAQEVYSIDESFLTPPLGTPAELIAWGRDVWATVGRYLGLPISVGIAPTTTLAWLTTQLTKKVPATGGVARYALAGGRLLEHPHDATAGHRGLRG